MYMSFVERRSNSTEQSQLIIYTFVSELGAETHHFLKISG